MIRANKNVIKDIRTCKGPAGHLGDVCGVVRPHIAQKRAHHTDGTVLQILRAESFEEALTYPSQHQYGNGVAIFTRNGDYARRFAADVEVGMVGINVPIPVPVSYHSFGGWKRSAFGDTNQYGMEGLRFWTKVKTVTQRWPDGGVGDGANAFVIPTL